MTPPVHTNIFLLPIYQYISIQRKDIIFFGFKNRVLISSTGQDPKAETSSFSKKKEKLTHQYPSDEVILFQFVIDLMPFTFKAISRDNQASAQFWN